MYERVDGLPTHRQYAAEYEVVLVPVVGIDLASGQQRIILVPRDNESTVFELPHRQRRMLLSNTEDGLLELFHDTFGVGVRTHPAQHASREADIWLHGILLSETGEIIAIVYLIDVTAMALLRMVEQAVPPYLKSHSVKDVVDALPAGRDHEIVKAILTGGY